jgi:hypothetical protein
MNDIVQVFHTLDELGVFPNSFLLHCNPVGGHGTSHQGFQFVSAAPLLSLADIQRDNHSSVCFVQLAVGMMHDSLLHRPSPKSPRSEFDMISRLKARLADVYLPSMTEESLLWACNQTTLRDFSSFPSSHNAKNSSSDTQYHGLSQCTFSMLP